MKSFKILLLCYLCLLINGMADNAVTNLLLTADQKQILERKMASVSDSLKAANENALSATDDSENIHLLVANVEQMSPFLTNGVVDPFGFGLNMAATVQTYTLDKGKTIEISRQLLEHILAAFTSVRGMPKEVCEGIRLVLLQNDYKLGKWEDGASLVRDADKLGISSSKFLREVAGFANGMITNGHFTNEALSLYEGVLTNNNVPNFSYGDALLTLSFLCGSHDLPVDQLNALNSIGVKDTNYFAANLATIAYWKYDAYMKLGNASNAVNQLVASAKAYQQYPKSVTDEVIRRDLPELVKEYKQHGYIGDDLTVIPYTASTKVGYVSNHIAKNVVLTAMLFVTFVTIYFVVRVINKA